MVVYIPMIAATTLLIWLAKHVKRNQRIVVLIMAIAIPVTVATLRYNNGADYLMYLRMMKLAEQTGSSATAFIMRGSIFLQKMSSSNLRKQFSRRNSVQSIPRNWMPMQNL